MFDIQCTIRANCFSIARAEIRLQTFFFLLFAWRKGRSTSVILVQFVCTLDKEISLKRLISNACDPAGARTQDPNIKSVVLYLLSYRVSLFLRLQRYYFFRYCSLLALNFFHSSNNPLPWRMITISLSVQSTTVLSSFSPAPPSMTMSTRSL